MEAGNLGAYLADKLVKNHNKDLDFRINSFIDLIKMLKEL